MDPHMPACEMCGKELPSLRRALIEGTAMSVCPNCIKFGVEQAGLKTEVTQRSHVAQSMERRAARSRSRDIYDSMQEELVEDYGKVVRDARTRRNLSVEELANQLMEKQSILAKVESNTYHPPDSLIRKLERALEIKLTEKPEAPAGVGGQPMKKSGPLTLGDLIKQELDKK